MNTQSNTQLTFFNSLRGKLLAYFLLMTIIPLFILGVLAYLQARTALLNSAYAELEAVRVNKTNQLTTWLNDRAGDAQFVTNLVVVRGSEGATEGIEVLSEFKDDTENPAYEEAFNRAEGVLSAYAENVGSGTFSDIMMVDTEGEVVFALDPNSLGDDQSQSPEFQNGRRSVYIGDITFNEVYDANEMIIAAPVTNSNDTIGVVFLRMNLGAFNEILNEHTGLGETGETYIVGQDKLFRSDSRFLSDLGVESTVLNPTVVVDTVGSQNALNGQTDLELINDYRGALVLSSYSPLTIGNLNWAILSEIDEAEALAPANQLRNQLLLLTLTATIVIAVLAVRVATGVANPVVRLTQTAQTIAAGNIEAEAKVESKDETSILADAFNTMTARLRDTLAGLEVRVAERTRAVETAADISRQISNVNEEHQLAITVVEQVQQAFDYYHAHIYLLEPDGVTLKMQGGTGEAGSQMLKQGHSLPVGTGLVGRAAKENWVVLVPDVSKEIGWVANPLLPNTKAEVAVPISIGNQILGVLDVQQNVVGGLGQEDSDVLQAIANQVAIAVQNARAYTAAEQRAQREAMFNQINQRILETDNVQEALQVAVRELGRAMGGQMAGIRLGSSTGDNGHTTNGDSPDVDNR